jgi:hypothetical protein
MDQIAYCYFLDCLKSDNCKLTSLCVELISYESYFSDLFDCLASGYSKIEILNLERLDESLLVSDSFLNLISSYRSPVREIVFGISNDSNSKLIERALERALESHSCQLTWVTNLKYDIPYFKDFKARQKKRLVMITIASASSRVGRNSSLRRFPTELQRMLSIFL